MASLLQALKARKGIPDKTRGQDSVFDRKRSSEIADLDRIEALPRRRWQEGIEEMQAALDDAYSVTAGSRPCPEDCVCRGSGAMALLPLQAAALADLHDFGGLLGPIPVGQGKTLLSFLAGTVCELDRVLLLVPAKLVSKTRREFKLYARHWMQACTVKVMSYELLSRERGVEELTEFAPEMIIADEGQKLKNPRSGCTKRIARYLKANPSTYYADLSGTQLTRHVTELHHRMKWALPESLWPLPKRWDQCRELGYAIDSKVQLGQRRPPGGLMRLCDASEVAEVAGSDVRSVMLDAARAGFGRRYVETPGVVGAYSVADNLPPIVLTGIPLELPQLDEHWHALRLLWETPSGIPLTAPVDVWRHARELSCGFHYYWDPAAPADWLDARREWSKLARDTLKMSRGYDTEMQIAKAVERGEYGAEAKKTLKSWQDIRPTFKPNNVAEWLSSAVLEYCANWADKNDGIIWTEHRAFGHRLAGITGLPYYANKGIDAKTGVFIEDCQAPTCIASIESNKEGRNLQYKWSKNLVTSSPTTGSTWEQMLGRTHRPGQAAEEVTVDVLLSCREQIEGFKQAQKDCAFQRAMQQQNQKLAVADIVLDDVYRAATTGLAWS